MDKVQQLYNLYLQKGIITSATTLEMFRAANADQQSDLYNLGKQKNLFQTTDLSTFQTAWVDGGKAAPAVEKKSPDGTTMVSGSEDSSLGFQSQQGIEIPSIENQIEKITPDFVEKNEEFVVPQMQAQFGDLGFKFEESGATGDWMTVTAPNKKQIEISLDIDWFSPGNSNDEANALKNFIRENAKAIPHIQQLENQYANSKKILTTQEEVDTEIQQMNQESDQFRNDTGVYLNDKTSLDQQLNELNKIKSNTAEYNAKKSELMAKRAELDQRFVDLSKKQEEITRKSDMLKQSVGKYAMMREQQGTWMGATVDWLAEGFGSMSASAVSNVVDLMFSKYTGGVDEEELSKQVTDNIATGNLEQDVKDNVAVSNAYRINEIRNKAIEAEEAKGNTKTIPIGTPDAIPMPAAGQSYKDWWNSLSSDQKTAIVDKSNDQVKKDVKKNLLPAVREGNEIVWGDDDTTVEWRKLKEEGFWGGAYAGLVKSLPAMIGSNNALGWAQRTAQMYLQTTDAVMSEMEKNPEFDNISEAEKLAVVAPIGIASAALESIGLRNIIANKGLMNRVILGAMGKAGATTTAKTFGDLVKNEVNSMVAKGALTLAGATLAEAETGAAQQVVEYAVKDIYSLVKKKEMFQTPDFLSAEYIKEIAKAGAQEAVGGFVLGMPSAVGAAYSKKGYLSMNDATFEAFESFANDSKLQSAFIVELKNKVATGLMTPKEAKTMLNDYRNSVGLFRELPDNLDTQGKKEAMNLLKERRDLEQQIDGKEESLVTKQKERIAKINEELTQISSKPKATISSTVINGNRIQVAPIEEKDRETVISELEQEFLNSPQADQYGFWQNGNFTGIRGNERLFAEMAYDALSVEQSQRDNTQYVLAQTAIATSDNAARIVSPSRDLNWVNKLKADNIYELFFNDEQDVPEELRPKIWSTNTNGQVAVRANGSDVQSAFRVEVTNQLDNNEVVAFRFNSLEEVPEPFRDEAREITFEGRKKVLGLPIGEKVSQSRYIVEMTGAEAKQYNVRAPRATTKADVFRNTAKSLASIFPDLQVMNFANANEMKQYAATNLNQQVADSMDGNENGAIIYDASGKPAFIFINDESSDATTLPHEAWHGILLKAFGENPALFKEFRESIMKTLKKNGFDNIVAELDAFSSDPNYIDSNTQAEEWLVQFGGLLTASGLRVDSLTGRGKSLLLDIKEILNKIAVKITGQPIFLEDATPDDILDFMISISETMARGEDLSKFFREGQGVAGGAGMRAQIVGEKASLSQEIKADLDVAKQMEDSGKDPETIRIATGWEKGIDGKWRYETVDDIPLFQNTIRLVKEIILKNKAKGARAKAIDILSNDLIKMYPQLADINIIFSNEGNGEGSWNANTNTIEVDLSVRTMDSIGTLLHEVQHAIQDIEGFERGANLYQAESYRVDEMYDELMNNNENFNNLFKKGLDLQIQFNKAKDSAEQIKIEKQIQAISNRLNEIVRYTYGDQNFFDVYERFAGEVESRNVETRKRMNAEARRQTPFSKTEDISRDKQILVQKAKFQRTLPSNIRLEPIDFENESENIDVYDASEKANQIAKDNGVNILRGKDLRSVAVDDNDNVVGGLWTEISGDEFSFDIAIDKESQRKGIGEELVNEAISEFNAQNFDDNLKYKIDVTNPVMEKLLSKYGFEVVDRYDGHAIMEHPTNNPKLKSETKAKFQRTLPEGLEIIDGWYSPIEKRLRETKVEKQSANKWLTGGVIGKGDEAIYTGVKGWLESKNPQEQVSKKDILDWMKDNRVEIVEVTKGELTEKQEERKAQILKELDDLGRKKTLALLKNDNEEKKRIEELEKPFFDELDTLSDLSNQGLTKYSSYQLEGEKENYKEVLVTLPSRYSEKERSDAEDKGVMLPADNKKTLFRSSHFEEPNILVHLRINTRTDADGNKVLFLEEVQSDWGQKGKKEGFIKSRQEIEKEYNEADKKLDELNKLFDVKYGADFSPDMLNSEDYSDYSSTATKRARLGSQLNSGRFEGVSLAPFVTNTNAWTKLGLKIALREAAKQGADKIAWTTGEQQNERYDLAKQVDYIDVFTNDDGTYEVEAVKGNNIISKEKSLQANQLEGLIGKELANKIIEDTKSHKHIPGEENLLKTYRGDDLRVGGKGMKGFYDKIVPDVFKSLVKEITGNDTAIETVVINRNEQSAIAVTPEAKTQVKTGIAKFQRNDKGEGMFTTRDGVAIGFNYDTDKVARERFDLKSLTKLGQGSDRVVFDLGDNKVLKVAKTARGLEQNIYEGDGFLNFVPEMYERGLNYVVVDNVPKMKASDMVPTFDENGDQTGEVKASEMINDLSKFNQRDFDRNSSELWNTVSKYGFEDIFSYDVLYGDFKAMRNWGYKDGKAYHTDGGTFGGVQMLTARPSKSLSDAEFREIYNKSKAVKKKFQDTDLYTKFQMNGSDAATIKEVQNIAKRYNINEKGFGPRQASEQALSRELARLGYSAKRSKLTPEGYGGGIFIVDGRGKFFNPFKIKFSRINLGAGRLEEGNVNTIPGYDTMLQEANRVAERTANRGASYDRIMEAVMQYVRQSKVYQDANDSQREQLERNVRAEFGKKEKAAPSVAKILGKLADIKRITISEKELLRNHFKDLARGARDAKRAFMEASADLAKSINELASSGKISPKQVGAIINRFSKVNMFNEDSVNRFVDYMTKVFNDAEYAEKISGIRTKLAKAKNNLKSKVGIAESVVPSLRQLFAVNPLIIPDDVFDKYVAIVDMFGASGAVLPLADINQVEQDVNEILDALDQEYSQAESFAILFDNYADKVIDEDTGKVKFAETVNKMVKEGNITEDQGELMKKYKSVVFPKEPSEPKSEDEINAEKDVLISNIRSLGVDVDRLPTKDERVLADSLKRLLKPEILKQLSIADLKNLIKLIDNINNGYMPHFGELAVERLNAKTEAINLGEALLEAKPLSITEVYNNLKSKFTKKGGILEMVRSSPFFFIDQTFGNFKTKPIFNALFKQLSESQSAFTSAIGRVNKKLDKAHDAVARSFKYDANKTLESSFRMMAYMIQLEYESNPGNPQVNPASEYIKATIKKIKTGKTMYGDAEIDMLNRILDENGNVDKDALYNSFNKAEREAVKTIREVNDSLTEKAVFTAAVLRGQRIEPLNNYVHLPVMGDYNPDDTATATENSNVYNRSLNPSSKAKNLLERTRGAKPINFDVFASAQRGAKFTLLDYYMTSPIRTARKTLNETLKKYEDEFTNEQRKIFNAVEAGFEEVIGNVLTNNFIVDSFADEVVNFISKQGYRAILASSTRFVAELTSNMGFVMTKGRDAFMNGLKYFKVYTSEYGVDIMDNVLSKNTSRIYHGDTLSGRFIDQSILSQASGVKSVSSKGVVANKANQIYNLSLKKYKNVVELVADTLISTPDKMIMRPVWFGQFASEFKKQSGVEVDFDKIAANDEQYMRTYKEEIAAARDKADEMSVLVGATDNPFMGMVKGSVKPNQGVLLRTFNNFNTFMTRFAIYEYTTARQGIYAAMGNGSISRAEGMKLLAAVTVRMTVYTMLTSVLSSTLLGLLGDEDEEDDKTLAQKLGQAVASTGTNLVLGRNFGNATRSLINYGVEHINEEFLDGLRNGDYDPYKDAISFSAIPKEKKMGNTNLSDFITNMSGSFSPAMKTANLIAKKAFEPEKKEKEAIERSEKETSVRIPLEVLGNMGLIPLYKDVRKVVMQDLYKDLRNAEKNAADKKQAEKEMLHGYENKTDMKRYDPELYEKVFGKDSPGYDAEQAKKKLKHEADSLERRMKDEFYDYVPKKKEKSKKGGFGSKGFGSEKMGSKGFGTKGFGAKGFGE